MQTPTGLDGLSEGPMLRTSFEQDGYCVLPYLFEASECQQWKDEALRVLREGANPAATVYVGAAAASSLFYTLASDERLLSVLREIMPQGIAFLSDKIVFKSHQQAFATPWHFDAAYWPGTRPKVSVWIALDAVDEQNGALKVLSGSHRRSWQPKVSDGSQSNYEFTQVIPQEWSNTEEIVCELPVGGVIVFSDRLLHASCPNTAGTDRYCLISTYHAPFPEEAFDLDFTARHTVDKKGS
jgi:ectoine hydroxylase-related dioxygenase (phytanoyl-CoA dioxygenase family)